VHAEHVDHDEVARLQLHLPLFAKQPGSGHAFAGNVPAKTWKSFVARHFLMIKMAFKSIKIIILFNY
jgi:hypothetical protein